MGVTIGKIKSEAVENINKMYKVVVRLVRK
jgi:hypothetical protein